MTKVKIKKIINILLSILMYLFLALSIFALLLTISARRAADGTAQFFGYQMRLVVSDSMAECEYTDVSEYEIKTAEDFINLVKSRKAVIIKEKV